MRDAKRKGAMRLPLIILGTVFSAGILAVGWFVLFFISSVKDGMDRNERMNKDYAPQTVTRLTNADRAVISDRNGVASGNNDEAKTLAKSFSNILAERRATLFSKGNNRKFSLTGGNFVTFCELHENSIAFIVHVPEFKKYEKSAKAALAKIAWAEAHKLAVGASRKKLAVGLRGTFLYGSIHTGSTKSANEDDNLEGSGNVSKPIRTGTDSDLLLPFFEESAKKTNPQTENPIGHMKRMGPTFTPWFVATCSS